MKEAVKRVEKEHCSSCSQSLIAVPTILGHKGESVCVGVSKYIYIIAVKECSANKSKRLGVSLVNKLQQLVCIDKIK